MPDRVAGWYLGAIMKATRNVCCVCACLVAGPLAGCNKPPGGSGTPISAGKSTTLGPSELFFTLRLSRDPLEEVRSGKQKLQFTLGAASYDLTDVQVTVTASNQPLKGGWKAISRPLKAEEVRKSWGQWKQLETKEVEVGAELAKVLEQVVLEGHATGTKFNPTTPVTDYNCTIYATWTLDPLTGRFPSLNSREK